MPTTRRSTTTNTGATAYAATTSAPRCARSMTTATRRSPIASKRCIAAGNASLPPSVRSTWRGRTRCRACWPRAAFASSGWRSRREHPAAHGRKMDVTTRRPAMPGSTDFARMVPGFDFLQGLVKSAGAGLPNISQWIAPTLDADELEKRIEELRTVQFWLEQNARMLGATIQALEVQRMTLSTLKTMNLPLAELRKSMELKAPAPAF